MSRCQRFDFRRLIVKDIADKLADIAKAENIEIDKNAVTLMARAAGGSLRDAENLLQQIATVNSGHIGLRQVQAGLGLTGDDRSSLLVKLITAGNIGGGLRLLSEVAADGVDLKQFNRELVDRLRQLLMVKAGSADSAGLSAEELLEARTAAESASLEQIMRALRGFTSLSSGVDMTTPLAMEMALVDAALKPAAIEKTAEKPEPVVAAEPAASAVVKQIDTVTKPREEIKQPTSHFNAAQPIPQKSEASTAVPVSPANQVQTTDSKRTEAAPVAAGPITTLEELARQWPGILSAAPPNLRRSTALAILRSAGAQPVGFSGGVVTLSFKFPIHMNKINEPENKRVTGEILSACIGSPCQVACVHEQVSNHLVKEAQKHGAEIINVEDKWISQK